MDTVFVRLETEPGRERSKKASDEVLEQTEQSQKTTEGYLTEKERTISFLYIFVQKMLVLFNTISESLLGSTCDAVL